MQFANGQKLESVFWADGESTISDGSGICVSIEVIMENGQMAAVLWALATYKDGTRYKYNLALAEGVKLKQETPHD